MMPEMPPSRNGAGDIPPIRVLIVDDHPVVREGLAALIGRRPDMTVVAEAGNGREAVAQYRSHRPDITLMDLRLPEMDGVAAVRAIREGYPGARFIVLTTYDGDEDVYRALEAGAAGYLLKDAPRESLMEAIRAVHAGRRWIPPVVAARLAERVGAPEITPRERDVLRLMAEGRTNQGIGTTLGITEGTVKVHVKSILAKLDAGDRTEAVTVALRRGILHMD